MKRAEAIAAASVTRTISSASSFSMGAPASVPEVARRPVNTIARWWRSATSIAISSRIEPPGWMIAVTPALAAIWMPSGNGKYASEAITASLARSPARRSAMSTDDVAARLAAPIPTVAPFRARTIAFERTFRTPRHANSRSVSSPEGRLAAGHDLELAPVEVDGVERLDQQPAAHALEVEVRDPVVAHALGRAAGRRGAPGPACGAGSRAPPR